MTEGVPVVVSWYDTEHDPELNVQNVGVNAPPLNETFPVGEALPVTVAVQVVNERTGSGDPHEILVVVGCSLVTVRLNIPELPKLLESPG